MNLIKYHKATFEKNKLVIDNSITIDEWKELGQSLRQVEGSVQFWIGDWARFGDKKGFTGKYVSSEVYDELEEITGLERRTLQNYKNVSDSVDSSRRREDLGFSHHAEVAGLIPEKQEYFLNKASEENLSIRRLREEISKKDVDEHVARQTQIEEEKELKEIAKKINMLYTKEQRKFFVSLIKI